MSAPFLGWLAESYDAALVANGVAPSKSLFARLLPRFVRLIALDGGVNTLRKLGAVPDLVIGDLDSAQTESLAWARERGSRILRRPSPDHPDISKGFTWCQERRLRKVIVLGVAGDRLDHVLSMMTAVAKFRSLDVLMVTNEVTATLLRGPAHRRVSVPEGHTLSWFGLPEARACSMSGVQWPFRNRILNLGGFHSLSNAPSTSPIEIRQSSGTSVLFISLYPQGTGCP